MDRDSGIRSRRSFAAWVRRSKVDEEHEESERAWRGSRARLQINTQRAPGYKYAEDARVRLHKLPV